MNVKKTKNIRKNLLLVTVLAAGILGLTGCAKTENAYQLQLRDKGIAYMESGQYEKALESFAAALDESIGKITELELDICYYKAKTQYLSQDVQGALDTYTAIINYNAASKAYYLRGSLYLDQEKEELALSDYQNAITSDGREDYELYIGIYESLKAKEHSQAEFFLEKALAFSKNAAYDRMQKGRICFMLGDYGEAVRLLEEAAVEEPESFYYLTEVYLATGNPTSAEETLSSYMEKGIPDASKLYRIAKAQMETGNYEVAITCLKDALKVVPSESLSRREMLRNLVIAYEQKSDFESAREVLLDYVQLYPDDEEAQRELTFLETR